MGVNRGYSTCLGDIHCPLERGNASLARGRRNKTDGEWSLVKVSNLWTRSELHYGSRLNVILLQSGFQRTRIPGREIAKTNLATGEAQLPNLGDRGIRRLSVRNPYDNTELNGRSTRRHGLRSARKHRSDTGSARKLDKAAAI